MTEHDTIGGMPVLRDGHELRGEVQAKGDYWLPRLVFRGWSPRGILVEEMRSESDRVPGKNRESFITEEDLYRITDLEPRLPREKAEEIVREEYGEGGQEYIDEALHGNGHYFEDFFTDTEEGRENLREDIEMYIELSEESDG